MIEYLHTKRSLDGAGGQRYIGDLQPQPRVLGKQQPIMSGYKQAKRCPLTIIPEHQLIAQQHDKRGKSLLCCSEYSDRFRAFSLIILAAPRADLKIRLMMVSFDSL